MMQTELKQNISNKYSFINKYVHPSSSLPSSFMDRFCRRYWPCQRGPPCDFNLAQQMTQTVLCLWNRSTSPKTMSSSNEADRIAQFQDLTGAPEQQARFFLESANWDFDVRPCCFKLTGDCRDRVLRE
jgi:hypothetical protein